MPYDLLFVLLYEFPVELLELIDISLYSSTQASQPEVALPLLLTKSITADHADARLVQQGHRIEVVWRSACLLCGLYSLGRKVQAREEVKRSGGWRTGHARERVQTSGHEDGSFGQSLMDGVRLLLPQWIAFLTFHGWANHAIHTDLSTDSRANADTDHLVQQRDRLVGDICAFEVTSSTTTFPCHTFRDGMEGDEWDGRLKVAYNFLERGECVRGPCVDVDLVHFVCEKDDVILFAEPDQGFLFGVGEHRADWVTGVDDSECFGLYTLIYRLCNCLFDLLSAGSPSVFGLIKIVGNWNTAVLGKGRSIKGILRDGDENPRASIRDEKVDEEIHPRGGTGCQEDLVGIGRVSIAF
jgi:hypothetical protein